MTFFELISNTFYNKTDDILDSEGSNHFNGYMFNRWLSFYSHAQATFVNDTLNKFGYIFTDKLQQYRLFFHLIPKLRFKKIAYIKKKKELAEKKDDYPYHILAKQQQLSTRELQNLIELTKQIYASTN